jgi:mediator of RNA polymerase II transcription subunit 17, fungi type
MAEAMLLPLRSSRGEPTWGSLETRVRQIESQKGTFRTVTEKSLLVDIGKAKSGDAEVLPDSEDHEVDDESPETKQKKLWEAREEMIKQLLRGQNETLTALDSISLLLSKYPKTQALAKLSMSPALSSAVPDSTLDAQKVRTTQLSTLAKQSESLYLGYKLDGLNKAIDKINSARARLDDQASNESAFWKQVADISAQGIVVSRLPRDSRTIGVHFGFPEAAPKFRNRGFAVLRTDQDGQLLLDQAVVAAKRYSVRVTKFQDDRVTGRSRVSADHSGVMTLAATVASLRRSLFEEELFFELGREARAIANQGVAIVGKTITADIIGGQKMEIELVDSSEQSTHIKSEEDDLVDAMVLCLRGLLSKGHEQSLARRSQPPAPLVPKAAPVPEYALLRPLLSHMRQQSLVAALRGYCESVKAIMDTAGLAYRVSCSSAMSVEHAAGKQHHREIFLSTLLAPADSNIQIALPTKRLFEVNIRTHLAPPAFGTVFSASPIEYASDTLAPPRMSNVDEVKSAVRHVLTTDIVELIASAQSSGDGIGQRWTSNGRYSGELRSHDASILVQVRETELGPSLGLRYLKRKGPDTPAAVQTWVWQGDQMMKPSAGTRQVEEPRKLLEVLKELSQGVSSAPTVT